MGSPLLDHLVHHAGTRPTAPFITFPPDKGRHPVTYDDAIHLVAALARALDAAGVGIGDRVVLQAHARIEVISICLATQWLGAVFVPLNPALGENETRLLLDDADPVFTLIGDNAIDHLWSTVTHGGAPARADLTNQPRPIPRHPDDPAAIIYTSGTTGRPKGAIVTHGNLASNAETLAGLWGFTPADVTVHALPTFHAHGLFVAVNTALVAGSSLRFLGRFDADRIIDALEEDGTVLMGVPTFVVRLLASDRFTRATTEGVRVFISGSAPLSPAVFSAFEERTGQRILEWYGMSETEMIASNPLVGERIAGTVGFPLPGVEVRIRRDDDPTRPLCGVDDPGGIEVRGPNVFAGYWRLPERRAEDFTGDGWFRTGDLGALDDQGRLRIVGRAKDLIISGGENVYPAEIEAVLDDLDGVAESAVVGMPDDDLGELGLAVVARTPDAAFPTTTSPPSGEVADITVLVGLLDQVRGQLASFKVPRALVVVDALPRNAMGKVRKAELREQFLPIWPEVRSRFASHTRRP